MQLTFAAFADLPIWLRGLFLGLALSAPVGPIGLLCIRRTIDKGPLSGLATGLGAAIADTFYASLAAFGVAAIIDILTGFGHELRLIGGIIMLVMSYSVWSDRTTDAEPTKSDPRAGVNLLGAVSSGFALTFTNPVTIIAVIALVTTFGAGAGPLYAGMLVAGVFLGASSWWMFLCGVTMLLRNHFSAKTITYINHATALLLSFFGIWVLGYTIGEMLPLPATHYLGEILPNI